MGVFSIFSSKGAFNPETFEKELTSITESINSNKQQIQRLKQRQKSSRRSIIRYLLLIYLCIVSYFYLTTPSGRAGKSRIQWFIVNQTKKNLAILIGYPLFSVLISKAVGFVFQFFINGKQTNLKNLQKKHKEKIEELKNITNFNKTNELINKYGDDKPERKQNQQTGSGGQQQQVRKRHSKPATIRERAQQQLNLPQGPQQAPGAVGPSKPQPPNRAASPVVPQQPVARTFQDRLLDILIGSDNSEAVENRYALICFNCFAHNGLAPPHTEDPAAIKFQCWKCGAMNGKGMLFDQPNLQPQPPQNPSPGAVKATAETGIDEPATEAPKSEPEAAEKKEITNTE
ncbi:Protein lunapark [Candida viswanathii]|uniref:Endoplasmic reticulum junction formation protein lunapark n=1 Tax=Candida viswanathii TaxID=5486 RepID=A0A367Y3R2_9ASCO|nr:Protein lunapark [Candida viswanathii]